MAVSIVMNYEGNDTCSVHFWIGKEALTSASPSLSILCSTKPLFISIRPEPNNQSAFTYSDCVNVVLYSLIFADRNKSSFPGWTNIMTSPLSPSIMYGNISNIQ